VRIKALVAPLLIVALMLPVGALAHSSNWKWDANDAGGPFDLHWTAYSDGHGNNNWSGKRRVWLCVRTYSPWQTWQLEGSKFEAIWFDLDTRGNKFPEYSVVFNRSEGGGLIGKLYTDTGEYKGKTNGYRFASHKGGCAYFKEYRIKPIKQKVRYKAFGYYKSQRVCSRGCFDWTTMYSHQY